MELEFDERYRKWHACNPADLFRAPVHKFVPEVRIEEQRLSLSLCVCVRLIFRCNLFALLTLGQKRYQEDAGGGSEEVPVACFVARLR